MDGSSRRSARVLVLYHSEGGHTKLMAELVRDGAASAPETEVRLRHVDEATRDDLVWCDGVAAGCPTYMGSVAWQMKRWWDEEAQPLWFEIEGRIGCAFTSSGGLAGGGELTCQTLLTIMMNYGLFAFGVPDYVAPGRTLHYGAICAGRPRDDADREACRRLGRRLAEWVQVMFCGRPEFAPKHATYKRLT